MKNLIIYSDNIFLTFFYQCVGFSPWKFSGSWKTRLMNCFIFSFQSKKHLFETHSSLTIMVKCSSLSRELANRPFAAYHSRGRKPPWWEAKVTLGQDKQRKLPFKIMYAFCWSCPSATFASQHGGFVPHVCQAAKGFSPDWDAIKRTCKLIFKWVCLQ